GRARHLKDWRRVSTDAPRRSRGYDSHVAGETQRMKVAAGQVEGLLRRPDPQIRAVLLFGPDAGQVRERADTLARAICPDLRDPFRVAELTQAVLAADPARLADEAAQISLMGGRRVIRLRDAGDAAAPLFTRFLPDSIGDGLVVAEAGDLPG